MQLGLLFYADINFVVYKHQGIDGNDKGFLVGRPVALRPNSKYVGLDLTWLDVKTSADIRLKS